MTKKGYFWFLVILILVLLTTLISCGGTGSSGGSDCAPSTPGGPGNPEIRFTSIPSRGSSDKVKGVVSHVKTDEHLVVLYIQVNGGWWSKPTWANPTTPISNCNGSWENSYASGGTDSQADQIAAFLIRKNYSPPLGYGDPRIPGDIERVALAKVFASR
jgi:hypothetical protein